MAKSKYVRLQDKIYKFVTDHLKTDKNTKADAWYLCVETDKFWTDCFDEVERDFKRTDIDPYEKVMSLEECVDTVHYEIFDWYDNKMNHYPGYRGVSMNNAPIYPYAHFKKLFMEVSKIITGKATPPMKFSKSRKVYSRR